MRRRAHPRHDATPPWPGTPPADAERIVWLLVSEAQAERALLAADDDMHDVKALGLLGLDGAAIAGLTAARSQLPPLWWIAVIALAVCVPFFLVTIRGWPFLLGPDLAQFYARHGDRPAAEAGARLLADLQGYIQRNRDTLAPKARVYTFGLRLFVLGSFFSAAFLARMSLVR